MIAFPERPRRPLFRLVLMLLTTLLFTAPLAAQVRLPQDHPYQVVLREYLATLTEADFAVELEALTVEDDWVAADDDLYRLWLLFNATGRASAYPVFRPLPAFDGLTLAADNFLLETIEGEEDILLDVNVVFAGDTAWWYQWVYPGNPYRGMPGVRNRAFAAAAVDLIMLDHLHESGTHWVQHGRRADFLGGGMIWLSYIHAVVKDDLPAPVRAAYETGLAKLLDRLRQWGPTMVNDNMDMKAVTAMAHLGRAMDGEPMADLARDYAHRAVSRIIHPSGMIRDAGGIEVSYGGIGIQYLVKGALSSRWPELTEALTRMSRIKAYMTLPDPDGSFFGPSNFALRTSPGSPNDQHVSFTRDVGAAMVTDEALYLLFGGRRGRSERWSAPDRETMLAELHDGIAHTNQRLRPRDQRVSKWVRRHWGTAVSNAPYDHDQPGFYERVTDLFAAGDPLTLPPFARPGETFMHVFPDPELPEVAEAERNTFLIVRFPEYGAIFDAALLTWHQPQQLTGFSGGTLSAFWTPAAGSLILGRTGGRADSDNRWEDWRSWSVLALSGVTPGGDAFSSARLNRIATTGRWRSGQALAEVAITRGEDWAQAEIRGPLGAHYDGSRTAQNRCLRGLIEFRRRFGFTPRGVLIETTLVADGADQVAELCETIPMFIGDTGYQQDVPREVRFHADGGWHEAGDEFREAVTRIRFSRFGGAAEIVFEQPQRVRLATERFQGTYMSRAAAHNILVDLLGSAGEAAALPDVSLRYEILPLGGMDAPAADPRTDWDLPDRTAAATTPARRRTAAILAIREGAAGLPFLQQALTDEDDTVRYTAIRALEQLGQAAAPSLIGVLADADPEVRRLALSALAALNALPPEHLRAALDDEDKAVRQAAADILDLFRHWDFLPGVAPAADFPRPQLTGDTHLYFDAPSGLGIAVYRSEAMNVAAGEWHHLVFTYDGEGRGIIALDGETVADRTYPDRGSILPGDWLPGDWRLAIGERAVSKSHDSRVVPKQAGAGVPLRCNHRPACAGARASPAAGTLHPSCMGPARRGAHCGSHGDTAFQRLFIGSPS